LKGFTKYGKKKANGKRKPGGPGAKLLLVPWVTVKGGSPHGKQERPRYDKEGLKRRKKKKKEEL